MASTVSGWPDYVCYGVVGEGAFGRVLRATRTRDDHTVAIKEVPCHAVVEKDKKLPLSLLREIKTLQVL